MATEDEEERLLIDLIHEAGESGIMSPIWEIKPAKPLCKQDFDAAVDMIFRDFGRYGRHSQECIYLISEGEPTHWLCAPTCTFAMRRRSREAQEDLANDPPEDPPWLDEEGLHW